MLQKTPSHTSSRSILREQPVASFIGFSWGPTVDAFDGLDADILDGPTPRHGHQSPKTPLPIRISSTSLNPFGLIPPTSIQGTPGFHRYPFATPTRPSALTPYGTLPRASTIRRTAPRRTVSDREAMKQLVDCIGMSARKKVLESGRKPRIITKFSNSRSSTLKELRFDKSVMVVNDTGVSYRVDPPSMTSSSAVTGISSIAGMMSLSISANGMEDPSSIVPLEDSTASDIPPSPSPSPRPGSAMSMLSKRSQTPTITGSYFLQVGSGNGRNRNAHSPTLLASDDPARCQQPTRPSPEPEVEAEKSPGWDSFEDELQNRYDRLMKDIGDLSGRLREVAKRIDRD